MNTRVLELIKNPKIITESDLHILESESAKMPYAQSIRALYLYGINLYKTENYKENLSKTAAYTTDKKILYQFINSQKNHRIDNIPAQNSNTQNTSNQTYKEKTTNSVFNEQTLKESDEVENTDIVLNQFDVEKIIEKDNQENTEFIVVEGEKNRLLYEGEENFLEEKTQEIDLEATKESGVIIVKDDLEIKENLIAIDENRSEETISEHKTFEEVLETPEEKTIEPITETKVQDEDSSGNISFNGIEDFLPQVKFSVPKNHLDYLNPPKREIKKEEQPLQESPILKTEYVEPIVPENTEIDNSQISFENTQTFEVSKPTEVVDIKSEIEEEISFENTQTFEVPKPEEPVIETQIQDEEIFSEKEQVIEHPVSEWKPMSFSANLPDALIGKTPEIEKPKAEVIVEEKIQKPEIIEEVVIDEKPIVEETPQITETERPVINVSFFGKEVSKIEEKKEEEILVIIEKPEVKEIPDSNVGIFINTWQSWLKIERKETAEEQAKVKEKIIDNFIETNPKISQLKEESSYVVKEKKDDISHLMTETLAKLYAEQKLYSKAIKAYEILSEKHPHKKDYFEEKIEEVKEIRKS